MKLKDITEEDIRDIADSTAILARGLNYYETGQIKSMNIDGSKIKAEVNGSYGTYGIEITVEDDKIRADCDCPYDGYGCKHIVAVLYNLINKKIATGKIPKQKKKKEIDMQNELSKLNKDELVGVLLALCQNYEDVKRDVTIKMSKDLDSNDEVRSIILSQIEDALYTREGFIDYYTVFEVVKKLEEIKKSVLNVAPTTKAYILRELARKSKRAYEHCDDSGGSMGDFVIDCLTELGKVINEQKLSFKEKKQIIQENFDKIEKEEYGLYDGYINLLLEIPSTKKDFDFMIKELKARIEKQKEEYEREKYETMLTEVYKRAGKDKEYLEILEENAKKEGDYLPLVEFWKEKGNIKKAIEIAEEGIKVEKDHGHGGLFEFLEEIYKKQKNKEDLLRIFKLDFNPQFHLSMISGCAFAPKTFSFSFV